MVSSLWDGILDVNTNVKEQVKTVKNVLKQFQNNSPSLSEPYNEEDPSYHVKVKGNKSYIILNKVSIKFGS